MTTPDTTYTQATAVVTVKAAVSQFVTALTETPQFKAFKQAAEALEHDESAQQVIAAYQSQRQALQMKLRLNAASAEERAELARLEQAFYDHPTVIAYLQAQQELSDLCQVTNKLLSKPLGLDFAAACRPKSGCCS
jgi:cell fate (sporulation/competence/biofilm development) regulator YlbF (YheA/YmcA/DUF963 family)